MEKNENLRLWEKVRAVPQEAKKPILGGRLKGKTDINPMWRIKVLTEAFGICGFGWYPKIIKSWIENSPQTNEISAFVEIELYIKDSAADQWGCISATGGSSFVAQEKNGPYMSDECFKMAYTDAISVACKMLGIGADVYWSEDATKYNKEEQQNKVTQANKQQTKAQQPKPAAAKSGTVDKTLISIPQAKRMFAIAKGSEEIVRQVLDEYGYTHSKDVARDDYDAICNAIAELV